MTHADSSTILLQGFCLTCDVVTAVLAVHVVAPEFSGPVLWQPALGRVTFPWATSLADSTDAARTLVNADPGHTFPQAGWFWLLNRAPAKQFLFCAVWDIKPIESVLFQTR